VTYHVLSVLEVQIFAQNAHQPLVEHLQITNVFVLIQVNKTLLMEPVLAVVPTAKLVSDFLLIASHVLLEVVKSIHRKAIVYAQQVSLKILQMFAWLVILNVKNAIPVLTAQYAEVTVLVQLVPVLRAISMMALLNSAKDAILDVLPVPEMLTTVLLVPMLIEF